MITIDNIWFDKMESLWGAQKWFGQGEYSPAYSMNKQEL